MKPHEPTKEPVKILRDQTNWEKLFFYQKTVVLYQMTYVFCKRFLPRHGDRTVDQMIQAARSGKQNIVEGCADGVTSTEMELKLLNVARASLKELKEDYLDYIRSRSLILWDKKHPRYDGLLKFCRQRNKLEEYEPFFEKWTDEELANCANTLCHMVDRMIATHLKNKETDFTENGGIRERMTAARLGRRKTQDEEIAALRAENASLKREIAALRAENASLKREIAALKARLGREGESRSEGEPRRAR
jgi:four helix bundle suffix protein